MSDTDYSKLNKDAEKVISKVDKDELVKLALDICNKKKEEQRYNLTKEDLKKL